MKTKATITFNSLRVFVILLLIISVKLSDAQFCTASGGCDEYISRVQFGSIDNSSGCNNYSDYTVFSTNVVQGLSYPITITNGNFYSNDSCDVWIDWNNDSIFNNTDEYYKIPNAVNPYTSSIMVPSGTTVGHKRMRIRIRYNGILDPCGTASSSYGEVEDYDVNVVSGSPMAYGSLHFNQLSGITVQGANDQFITLVKVVTTGSTSPVSLSNIYLHQIGSTSNISAAKLFYTGNNRSFSTSIQFGSTLSSPGTALTFSGTQTLMPDTNYFWLAYNVASGATLGAQLKGICDSATVAGTTYTPNTQSTTGYVEVQSPMTGTYVINKTGLGDYTSFNHALTDLSILGVSGPVIFNVDSGTYVEQLVIGAITGASATNTITFQSSDSDSSKVNLTYAPMGANDNYTILLNSAAYITFRMLTISSAFSYDYSQVIQFQNTCSHINFLNNMIVGSLVSNGWSNDLALVMAHYNSILQYVVFSNNILINGSAGIKYNVWQHTSNNHNTISSNIFYNQGGYGFTSEFESNFTASQNQFIARLLVSYYYAIQLYSGVANLSIRQNDIQIMNANSAFGIYLNYYRGNINPPPSNPGLNASPANSHIANNFISINGSGSGNGIYLYNDTTLGVYYNSVNITGSGNNANALYLSNGYDLEFKNNIFSNHSGGFAIEANQCNNCESDYNDIYSTATLANLDGTSIPDLTAWVSAIQNDSNSISLNPQFLNDTNLHIQNIALNGLAQPIAGITLDIDGQTRSTSMPDIGADEFSPPANDLELIGFVDLPSGCGLSNSETIKVVVKNSGTSNFSSGGASVKFQVPASSQLVNETLNKSILSNDTVHFTFSTGAMLSAAPFSMDTNLIVNAWVDFSSDANASNDSISDVSISKILPASPTASGATINYGTSALLTAVSSDAIYWYSSDISTIELAYADTFRTPLLYDSTTYYVAARMVENDTVVPGAYVNTYTSSYNTRGYHFVAPTDFVIRGLRVPDYISSEPQHVQVVRFSGPATGGTAVHTQLFYANQYTGSGFIPCNIPIQAGEYIAILGSRGYTVNRTDQGGTNVTIDIFGHSVDLIRTWSNSGGGSLYNSPILSGNITRMTAQGYNIGRVEMIYENTAECESFRTPVTVNVVGFPAVDIGILAINTPNSGFEVSTPQAVSILIKNFGTSSVNSFSVSYQKADTSSVVMEQVNTTILPGDSLVYTFTQLVDISALGSYPLKAWTTLTADNVLTNDTANANIENFTHCEAKYGYSCYYSSIGDFSLIDISNMNSGCNSNQGNHIIYPESSFTTDIQTGVSHPFSIKSGYSYAGFAIWIDLNHDGDFDDTDECVYRSTGYSSSAMNGFISVPSTYGYYGKTKMRVRSKYYSTLNITDACTYFPSTYGETEDYVVTLTPPPLQKDLKTVAVIKPNNGTFQLIPENVEVSIKNIGLDSLWNIPLSFIFNGGSVVNYIWPDTITPQQTAIVTLPSITATTTNNSIIVYSGVSGDQDTSNDTLTLNFTALPAPPIVSVVPASISGTIASCDSNATTTASFTVSNTGYQPLEFSLGQLTGLNEDFENGLNKWIFNGNWGLINNGYNGGFALTESPVGSYGDGWNQWVQYEDSLYVNNADSCLVEFMLSRNMECCCDYLRVQINVNNTNWTTINPTYNCNGSWSLMRHSFTPYVSNGDFIKFRFEFTSDGSVTYDGVLIDDIQIKGVETGNWLSLNDYSDTLSTGGSSTFIATMRVGQLNAGTHLQTIMVQSNDPITPLINIPASLTIIGAPEIVINDTIINYPSIMAGATIEDTTWIYNTGCDTLMINSIAGSDTAFIPIYPSFIKPRDSLSLVIKFNPFGQGLHEDTLIVNTNDVTKRIYVSGTALPSPRLLLDPDSVNFYTQVCDDTLNASVKIKNIGNANMVWEAVYSQGPQGAVKFNGSSTSEINMGDMGAMPNQGTIEFWMRSDKVSGTNYIMGTDNQNYSWTGINIYSSGSYVYVRFGNDAGSSSYFYFTAGGHIQGTWNHLAVSWDKNTNSIQAYFNGQPYYSGYTNSNWASNWPNLHLGWAYGYSSTSYRFNGAIDDFRVWTEVRSHAQIMNSYQSAYPSLPIDNLDLLFSFNETSGDSSYNFMPMNVIGVHSNVTRISSEAGILNPQIEVLPYNGVIAGGDSNIVQITLYGNGLNSGIFNSDVFISTNDPLNLNGVLPIEVNINGEPDIAFDPNYLSFDSIMAGQTIIDSVHVINTGCDTLFITGIANTNPVYSMGASAFTILPKDTAKLFVTFNPTLIGTYLDTIAFSTNIGEYKVAVYGVGLAAPIASVFPTSFAETLTICNGSVSKSFKIYNTGNEILNWNASTGGVGLSDNFNTGIDAFVWNAISGGIAASSCGVAAGANSLYFNGSSTRSATTTSLNTVGGGSISFYLKFGNGGSPCENADSGEDVVLEYSIDNGSSWGVLSTYDTEAYLFFTQINVAIPPAAQSFATMFRWRQVSHSGSCCDHWAMDEVVINTLNINNATPSSGSVAINDSVTVQVVIDAQGLINGTYNSQIYVQTNDPVSPAIIIPVTLLVQGSPIITFNGTVTVMDSVQLGLTSVKDVYIMNTGCDTLNITNITNTLTDFSFTPTTLNIAPRDSGYITVSFSSLSTGTSTDTYTFTSNAGTATHDVRCTNLGAPEIITEPGQITKTISCDVSQTAQFKIKNPGIVPLNWEAYIAGQKRQSLLFDGINDWVSLGNWSPGYEWTVEAWVKPANLNYGEQLIAGSYTNCEKWGIYLSNGKFAARYRSSSTCYGLLTANNYTLSTDTWYHVAASYDGTSIRIFINGQLQESSIVNYSYYATNNPSIGGNSSTGRWFSGEIDDVRFWNTNRSEMQINRYMNYLLTGNETSLMAYYDFSQINGSLVPDLNASANHGVLYGASKVTSAAPTNSWVTFSADTGSIVQGDSVIITLGLNRRVLPPGTHQFNLIVESDDPIKPYDTTGITINAVGSIIPVDLGLDTNMCSASGFILDAGTYSSYLWSDLSTNSTINVSNSGSYWVQVTDANSCTYSDTINLGISQSPIADAGLDKSICMGQQVVLNGSATLGTTPYQYMWKKLDGTYISSSANYYFYPTVSDTYLLTVSDNNGCNSGDADTAIVTVNPQPTVFAGNDTTVDLGSSVILNGSVSGGTSPYNILWNPGGYTNLNPSVSPTTNSNYTLTITDAKGCSALDAVYVNIRYSVSGQILYDNSSQTLMTSAKVFRKNYTGVLKDSVTTSSGSYLMGGIPSGSHRFYARPTTAPGGINSADALSIRRHVVQIAPLNPNGASIRAADVNGSGSVSSVDALLVLRYTVGFISSFPNGYWTSDEPSIGLYNSNISGHDIHVLSIGDVNGSYLPGGVKQGEHLPELLCSMQEETLTANQEIEIPITLDQNIGIGALSLYLDYPDDLIEIIRVYSSTTNLEFLAENGTLAIALYDENTIKLTDGKLLTIVGRVKESAYNGQIGWQIQSGSELNTKEGAVITDVTLGIPCYRIAEVIDDFAMVDNYPNPFRVKTIIRLYVPSSSSTVISLMSPIGQIIRSIDYGTLETGWHEFEIDASELPAGAYMYRVQAKTHDKVFDQTRSMLIVR